MHAVTESVRDQYERYPYPTGVPAMRQASDARLLLSYVEHCRPEAAQGNPIRVLDAGCGRGVGLVGCAALQPDVEFTGVDVSQSSLDAARAEAAARGLANVRLQELDLMTLEGLEVPEGGFDVILSSGVLHHLVDPAEGLRKLEGVLAPHGVVSLMVYGRRGREGLYRLVHAIDALVPRERPLEERLAVGRGLVRELESDGPFGGPWDDLTAISDAEFVDRYLNVHETNYDVRDLFELIDGAGLGFVRWSEPADWALEVLLPPGEMRERALQLEPRARWQLVDELFDRPRLEAILCKRENAARTPIAGSFGQEPLALSPEMMLEIARRNLRGAQRTEGLRVTVRKREPLDVPAGAAAQALTLLSDQTEPFLVADLVQALGEVGVETAQAMQAVSQLLALEVFYRPHRVDVA